jgi:hypothetical protein
MKRRRDDGKAAAGEVSKLKSSSSSDDAAESKSPRQRKRARLTPSSAAADAETLPTISFRALDRAQRSLEDFSRSYFMFVDLDGSQDFWKYFATLVFVEASIYQMDEQNEDESAAGTAPGKDQPLHGKETLEQVLRNRGLLDKRVQAELENGYEYWRLERRICAQLLAGSRVDMKEALRASELKSFDYRLSLAACRCLQSCA